MNNFEAIPEGNLIINEQKARYEFSLGFISTGTQMRISNNNITNIKTTFKQKTATNTKPDFAETPNG